MKGWGYTIIIAVLIATSVKSAIADWNDVPTGSMKPTILEGDRIFVNKLAYDLKIPYTTLHISEWDSPRRGDIVVFYSPTDGTRLVKRVVGIPGDTLFMVNKRLFINGKPLAYSPLDDHGKWEKYSMSPPDHSILNEDIYGRLHPVLLAPFQTEGSTFPPVSLPAESYFMMGDNRDNSADSRFFGPVLRKNILGKATAVAISREGNFLHPRWGRFFTKLL